MAESKVLKQEACRVIDEHREELNSISLKLWNKPELNFEEVYAHDLLTQFLEEKKFNVEKNFVLKTGFRATRKFGDGPNIVVICEYDALPEIGHACGHNLIAEAGIGAGLGIARALETAFVNGHQLGTLTLMGTPAEEGGGGKVFFIEKDKFANVDVAMMCHPAPLNTIVADSLLANEEVEVKYIGKASHAAGFPWEGINALDAAVQAYSSISAMRQHMKPTWRVHGIITNGGAKPNIIPEESELNYYIRAPTYKELQNLKKKVVPCFEGAAVATGCKVEIKWVGKPYANLITNPTLAELFEKNLLNLGHEFTEDQFSGEAPTASTDMGNVSHVVPSIHPMFYIGTKAVNHTREFTVATGAPEAQPFTILQAKAMAMTALDVFCNEELLQTIKKQFKEAIEKENAL